MGGSVSQALVRALRNNPTASERALWRRLRQRQFIGFKFRRQHPLGSYIVDFVCLEKKLVIEIDGSQHAECADDVERTSWLENRGFRVVRFWNNQVSSEIESVSMVIWDALSSENGTPHLNPPPQGVRKHSTRAGLSLTNVTNGCV